MMHPDPSCDDDLALARAAARRLGVDRTDAALAADHDDALRDEGAGFAPIGRRIAADVADVAGVAGVAGGLSASAPPAIDLRAIESTGAGPWEALLEWARRVTGATGAFIADKDGLLIGSSGSTSLTGGFDTLAPHVVVSFNHLPALGDPPCAPWSLSIQAGGERLVAVRFDSRLTGEVFLVALVSTDVRSTTLEALRSRAESLFIDR